MNIFYELSGALQTLPGKPAVSFSVSKGSELELRINIDWFEVTPTEHYQAVINQVHWPEGSGLLYKIITEASEQYSNEMKRREGSIDGNV